MAINKISEFPKVTPSADDKILIEKNGEGGHINLSEMPVSTPVNTKISSEVSKLTTQLDNLILNAGDSSAECAAARVNSNTSVTYPSLKARLDAEHSELKGDLDEMNSRLINQIIVFDKNSFEIGSIDGNGTNDNSNHDRIRTKTDRIQIIEKDTTIYIKNGYQIAIHYYENNIWKRCVFWKTESYELKKNEHVRFVIAKISESTSTVAELYDKVFYHTPLMTDVNNNTEAIKELDKILEGKQLFDISIFERGSITAEGINDNSSTERIRIKFDRIVSFKKNVILFIDKNIKIAVHFYENNVWKSCVYWKYGTYDIEANQQFRLVVAKEPDSASTVEELYDKVKFSIGIASKVEKNSVRITNIEENIFTNKLPAYWVTHLNSKMPLIKDKTEKVALNGDSFIFLTDYHIEDNMGYSHLLVKDIIKNTTINNMVFGGDIFNGSESRTGAIEKINTWFERFRDIPVYGIRGNHEYNWFTNEIGRSVELSESQIYNYLVKKNEFCLSNNGKHLYYYIDNTRQKIRYIFLDTLYGSSVEVVGDYIIDDAQLNWMRTIIAELDSEWTVVVFTHQYFEIAPRPYDGHALNYNESGARISQELLNAKAESDCTIACVICGHSHLDYSNNGNGFVEICTTCDTRGQDQQYSRLEGTSGEHAFDVFSIDTKNRKIYATRIGEGSNREWSY